MVPVVSYVARNTSWLTGNYRNRVCINVEFRFIKRDYYVDGVLVARTWLLYPTSINEFSLSRKLCPTGLVPCELEPYTPPHILPYAYPLSLVDSTSMPLTYQLDVKKFKLIAKTKVIVIYDDITTYARVYVFGLPWSSSYGLPTLEITNDNAGKLVQYYWFWRNCDPSTIEIMFTYNKQPREPT